MAEGEKANCGRLSVLFLERNVRMITLTSCIYISIKHLVLYMYLRVCEYDV